MPKSVFKNLNVSGLKLPSRKKQEVKSKSDCKSAKESKFKGIRKFIPAAMGNIASSHHHKHHIENENEYATAVMAKLSELRENDIGCDVTIVDSEIGTAHKIVVSYNKTLLEMTESKTIVLKINENEHASANGTTNGEPANEGSNVDPSAPTLVDLECATTAADDVIKGMDGLVSELKLDDVTVETSDDFNIENTDGVTQDDASESVETSNDVVPPPLFSELSVNNDVANTDENGDATNTEEPMTDKEIEANATVETATLPTTSDSDDTSGTDASPPDYDAVVTPNSLKNPVDVLVNFLYTSHIDITKKNVAALRVLANQCGIVDIVTACNEFDVVLQCETQDMATNEQKDATASQFRYRYSDPTLPSKMLQHFNALREEKRYTDLVVFSPSRNITMDAHAVVLLSSSNFFEPIEIGVGKREEFEISEVDENVFGQLVNYIYTGRIGISSNSVAKIMKGAQRMQLSDVIEGCAEYLESTVNTHNCIQYRTMAIDYNCKKLKNHVHEFIVANFHQVSKSCDFMTLSVGGLVELMTSHHLHVEFPLSEGEMEVFQAIKRWINHDEINRTQHLEEVMNAVRFPLISYKHLIDDVTTDAMIMDNENLCKQITSVITNKPNHVFDSPVEMRGVECIATLGGSITVSDVTSDEQGYQAVSYTSQFTLYDPSNGHFHDLSNLPEKRSLHCAVACDNFLVVAGGHDHYSCIVKSAYCFDLSNGKWYNLPNLRIKRSCFSMHVIGGYVFAVAGLTPSGYTATVERLDRRKKTWAMAASLPLTRYRHAGCVLNNEIIISGGSEKQDDAFSYNPDSDSWSKLSPLNKGRDSHVMATVGNRAYAIGGSGIEFSAEYYEKGQWTLISSAISGVHAVQKNRGHANDSPGSTMLYFPGVAVIDDNIYLLGGWQSDEEVVDRITFLDTTTNEWRKTTNHMLVSRGSAASCTVRIPKNYWKIKFASTKESN